MNGPKLGRPPKDKALYAQQCRDERREAGERNEVEGKFGTGKRCYGDNSWSESFFANLKKEAVHWVHFRTRAEARQKLFTYIEGFYNTRRVQKRLGYISPMQWMMRWNQSLQTCVA